MVEVSIIGCGHLGSALIKGLSKSGTHTITACDVDSNALEAIEPYCQVTTTDIEEAAESEVVLIAVKPNSIEHVLEDIELSPDQTLITVAAGVSREFVAAQTNATVVRVMPNLAAETGSMAATVTGSEIGENVRNLLDDLGLFVVVDEDLMDVATALNGSGPAFVFYFIQAMKNAGIQAGLEAEQAEALTAQTFKGASEMVLQSEENVDDLIDAVCSPNGTTIEGMEVLWDSEVETTISEALFAATDRARELAETFDND